MKRFVALLLASIMVFSMLPTSFATVHTGVPDEGSKPESLGDLNLDGSVDSDNLTIHARYVV